MVQKFRKKPVEIEAIQWNGNEYYKSHDRKRTKQTN